ncbi:hypothetical protein GCG21_08675 [Pseudactinotalea sp. HY160]|uniref:hypothetical protein n=1 Tax=Pseudactinotalea sp. HY160 TaxID=2654490 RepID=UPI00128D4548|nr:hypothetical protein [Pseudactinotalea sp. HY160]MPV50078.1 hypothetical protein [Pseudactinotalea sp. HY160]
MNTGVAAGTGTAETGTALLPPQVRPWSIESDVWWVDPQRICTPESAPHPRDRRGMCLDPWAGDQWGIGPFDSLDVTAAELCDRTSCPCDGVLDMCRECHLARIAQLVDMPIDPGDPHPITVDSFADHWPIVDGNHRIVASLIRGDGVIPVAIEGDIDDLWRILVA